MTLGLTRWTPTSDLFRDRVGRLFDQIIDESVAPAERTEGFGSRHWVPAVDIKESDEALTLTAELPGLAKENVNLSIENNVLTLTGERKFEKDVKQESYHRIERAYGSFSRSFTLPNNVKAEAVDATFVDGVLNVVLPKIEEAKPRSIEIR